MLQDERKEQIKIVGERQIRVHERGRRVSRERDDAKDRATAVAIAILQSSRRSSRARAREIRPRKSRGCTAPRGRVTFEDFRA